MWRAQHLVIADGISPYAEESDAPGTMRVIVYAHFAPEHREADVLMAHWRDEMAARFPGGLTQMQEFLDVEERRLRALVERAP